MGCELKLRKIFQKPNARDQTKPDLPGSGSWSSQRAKGPPAPSSARRADCARPAAVGRRGVVRVVASVARAVGRCVPGGPSSWRRLL